MANLRANNLTGTGGRNAIDGSVYFSGVDDYLDISSSAIAAAIPGGDEPYTIEMWVKLGRGGSSVDSGGSDSFIAWGATSTRGYNGIDWTGTAIRNVWYADDLSYTINLNDGAWHHVAATYDQTTRRLFVDGVLGASDTPSDHAVGTTNNGKIGASTGGVVNRDFKGYISNLRITKRAIYTAAFTPPTEKLTAVDGTVLLCCQDSDDPTQEATGKTITGYGKLNRIGIGTAVNASSSDWMQTGDQDMTITGRSYMTTGGANPSGVSKKAMLPLDTNHSYSWYVNVTTVSDNVGFRGFYGGTAQNLPSSPGYMESTGEYSGVVGAGATAVEFIVWQNDSAVLEGINIVKLDPGKAPKVIPPVGVDEGVVFEGDTKVNTQSYMYFPTGDTAQRGRGRGVFAGGYTSVPADAALKRIYYIEIDSMGTSAEFGDTNKAAAWGQSGCSSSTRGLITGGTNPANLNTIDYITIATTSNALDFGDLSVTHGYTASCSNNTRGLTGGGRGNSPTQRLAQIDYNTIATTGNGIDFGDLTQSRMGLGAVASSTRGVFTGGNGSPADPSTVYNNIDYVEFATTGNATDFGDMTDEHTYHGSCSSSTRGIIYGGVTSYGPTVTTDIIEYLTIASTGNGTDFGDVRDDGAHAHGTSNGIRGVFAGGVNPYRNSIDYITIATTGNGVDWGDLPDPNGSYAYAAGLSDSHGGLS